MQKFDSKNTFLFKKNLVENQQNPLFFTKINNMDNYV